MKFNEPNFKRSKSWKCWNTSLNTLLHAATTAQAKFNTDSKQNSYIVIKNLSNSMLFLLSSLQKTFTMQNVGDKYLKIECM